MDDDEEESEEVPRCPICLEFLVGPLKLVCGHAMCRKCLVCTQKLAPDKKSCPVCRKAVTMEASSAAVDVALEKEVLARVDAAVYGARLAADLKVVKSMMAVVALPVFYLDGVPRPGDRVALHLFEMRYRLLARQVWAGNKLFAYAGGRPAPGVRAALVRVERLRFTRDGRAHLDGRAIARFVLDNVHLTPNTRGLLCTNVKDLDAILQGPHDNNRIGHQGPRLRTSLGCLCSIM